MRSVVFVDRQNVLQLGQPTAKLIIKYLETESKNIFYHTIAIYLARLFAYKTSRQTKTLMVDQFQRPTQIGISLHVLLHLKVVHKSN